MAHLPLSPFQTAWVTNDLDRSLRVFRDIYNVPSFLVFESNLDGVAFGRRGRMKLRIALADVDNVQLELIQPLGDGTGPETLYSDVLPSDGSFATIFHHVCVRVEGAESDWDQYLADLQPERPVCYLPDIPVDVRACYTDDRPLLGHYVEHIWYGEESARRMRDTVPRYRGAA